MKRSLARERALQLLFQIDVGEISTEEAIEYAMEDEEAAVMDEFTLDLIRGTRQHINEIDALLQEIAKEWPLTRMANVDRNVLRMAIYEMKYRDDIPFSVAINEAVEVAKKYSTPESGKFVNGILGKLADKSNDGTMPDMHREDGQ